MYHTQIAHMSRKDYDSVGFWLQRSYVIQIQCWSNLILTWAFVGLLGTQFDVQWGFEEVSARVLGWISVFQFVSACFRELKGISWHFGSGVLHGFSDKMNFSWTVSAELVKKFKAIQGISRCSRWILRHHRFSGKLQGGFWGCREGFRDRLLYLY